MLIEIQIISPFGLHSALYIWVAPAWLVWYLFARASARSAPVRTVTPEAAR
jgi:hypothetical protein